MYRIFLIVIVIILYGSLYPWGFHPTQLAASPLWVLIHSWPTGIDRFLHRDIVVNLLIFEPVGVFGFLALQQDFCTSVALIVTLLSALVLSSSIEMNQLFEDGRERTIFDIVLNVSGTAVGIVLGHLYQK